MGFTLRYILGVALVLHFSSAGSTSTWERYVREAILTEAPRASSEKAVTENGGSSLQSNATNPSVESLNDDNSKPKTEKTNLNKVYNRNDIFTTETNRLRSKLDTDLFLHDDDHLGHEKEKTDDDEFTSDTTYGFPSRSESGRSIDFEIKKYTPEYKNKNNVFGRSVPPEDKFASQDFDDKYTYKEPDFSYFESTTEYKIPHYSFFDPDDDFAKVDDELADSKEKSTFEEEPLFSESKDTTSFHNRGRSRNNNGTKVDIDFLKLKRFDDSGKPPKKDKNTTRKNFVTEKRTSINYNSSFNKTEILDDKPKENPEVDTGDGNFQFRNKPRYTNYESTTHKNIIYKSFVKKNNVPTKDMSMDDDEDDDFTDTPFVRATTHKTLIYHPTTRKTTVLTKPPALNNSHVPLLNNKIESETVKNIETTTVRQPTTRRPVRKETTKPVRVATTRRSTVPRVINTMRSSTSTTVRPNYPIGVTPRRTAITRLTTTTQAPATTVELETTTTMTADTTDLSARKDDTASSLVVDNVAPVSVATDDSAATPSKDTTSSTSIPSTYISSSASPTTTAAATTSTTTDFDNTTSTKQPTISTTIQSRRAQTRGEKEIPSHVPTKNTVINISKRGSVRFNSATTELNRVRSTGAPKVLDAETTTIRITKPFRSSIRNRPVTIGTTTTEREIDPVLTVNPVTPLQTDTTAAKRELTATTSTEKAEVVNTSEETIEKVEAASAVQNAMSTTQIDEATPDTSTLKVPSTTSPHSRRRVTSRNFVPKIITSRYSTTTTTTTTTTGITTTPEEETEESETTTTDQAEETQNLPQMSSTTSTHEDYPTANDEETSSQDVIINPITDEDMNYTVSDDMDNSTKYSTEIESVMNNSFVVTSSTTEQYSYEVSGVTETASEAAAENTNLVPKVTTTTTTTTVLSDDYEDDDGTDEEEKLPNQTDESEHSTHGHEAKSFDENDNKEEEDRTENEEYTESPYYSESDGGVETTTNFELQRPKEENGGTIAAIVISCVGAICLIILAALLILVRKRQKRFNYGQRCTPVGLDAYSMDNVSVYNSVRRKGIMRASKRSYGNPAFEDPDSVSHPLNFPALAKFATNIDDISAEFGEIPQVTTRTSELPEGCDVKNRYANVIPLPESRVFLTPIDGVPNSDYINANYVTGPRDAKGYYIACQAPLQNTIEDFWRMVWEQQTKLILMLTHLFENGSERCAEYMPPSEITDCHRLYGDFQVTLKKREVKDKYIISSLQLKNMVSNSWREVTHFWYLGWPEKGVPLEANSLIAFLIEARSYVKHPIGDNSNKNKANGRNGQNSEMSPIVVHCSPGTGRTGTVIACDIAIREFELSRLVDIPKIVYKIRRDRASSVQTKDQYAFIYKVISVYATKLTGGSFDSL